MRRLRNRLSLLIRKSTGEIPFWLRACAWIGAGGLGLTVFLLTVHAITFEYHSYKGVIATSAFLLYPEQKDLWIYILALTLIPLCTIGTYIGWATYIALIPQLSKNTWINDVAFVTFSFLLWWSVPLAYIYTRQMDLQQIWLSLILFLTLNGVLIVQRSLSRAYCGFPSLSQQGAVAILGVSIGTALIVMPGAEPAIYKFPLRVIISTSFGLWMFWLGGVYLLGKVLHREEHIVATNTITGLLPLSFLPTSSLFWQVIRQADKEVLLQGVQEARIAIVVVIATAGTISWALWALIKERGIQQRLYKNWIFFITIPVLLYVLAYNPNIHRPLDLFHEGERLSTGYAIARGRMPFKEVVFIHGFLRDPGIALIAFHLFGESVASLRTLEQLLYPMVLVFSYYLAVLCFGRILAVLYSLLVLSGFWPFFWDWRLIPVTITFIFVLLSVYRRSVVAAIIAAWGAFFSLATSMDMGVLSIITASTVIGGYYWLNRREGKGILLGFTITLGGILFLIIGWLTLLGILLPCLQWNLDIIRINQYWNGMPFPDLFENPVLIIKALLSPIVSIIAIITLVFSRKNQDAQVWTKLLLLISNIIMYNRAIIGGQLHSSHLLDGGHFAPFLLFALLAPKIKQCDSKTLAIGFLLVTLIPSPLSSGRTILSIVDKLSAKNRIEVPTDWVLSDEPRIGPIYIPAQQEERISKMLGFLRSKGTFWDFTDHGSLYFLSEHLSPTRFYLTHHIITLEHQREVITDLEQSQPSFVLFRSNTGWDAIAGVDRVIRSFLVSEYLLRNYHFYDQIGGFTVLERGISDSYSQQPLAFRVDLGYIPFLWGKESQAMFGDLDCVTIGGFPPIEMPLRWHILRDISMAITTEEGWKIQSIGSDPQLETSINLFPKEVTHFRIRMKIQSTSERDGKAQLFWRSDSEGFSEERSVVFNVVSDGREHIYLIHLASLPSWMWSKPITNLRLDPINERAEITIHSIDILACSVQTAAVNEPSLPATGSRR